MTITRIIISIASFSFALITGFRTGANLKPIAYSFGMNTDTMPGVAIPNNDQFNLLVIGVDDAEHPGADLQSVWILAFPDGSTKVNLIPVFPDVNNPVRNLILAESFHLHNGKPTQEFWDTMKTTDTWWQGYTVSDRQDLIGLIDLLGGITINRIPHDGTQAVDMIPAWKYDPQNALAQQKIVFEGICRRIAKEKTSQAIAAPGKFIEHMKLSPNTTATITQWSTQIAIERRLNCYFPTFVEFPTPPAAVIP